MSEPIKAANCKCAEEFNDGLVSDGLYLPIRNLRNTKTNVSYQALTLTLFKAATGSPTKRFAIVQFCPFCGVAYKTEDEKALVAP